MKLTDLEPYVLFLIARLSNAPELLNLVCTCKQFRKCLDCESVWKERNRSETFSPRQSRCNVKKIKATSKTLHCVAEAKRIYISWWTCFIQQRKKLISQLFEREYEQALLKCLRQEVSNVICGAIATKLLCANITQVKCRHGRIIFNFAKKLVYPQQRMLIKPFVLHTHCSSCKRQCVGSVRYCCCCEQYLCETCFQLSGKAGHDRHPFTMLSHPEKGCNLNCTYTCGCFDCGITVQVEIHANTGSPSTTIDRPKAVATAVPLVEVIFRCAGVDGLFRQLCKTEKGQQELLGRFRTADDFLLEI